MKVSLTLKRLSHESAEFTGRRHGFSNNIGRVYTLGYTSASAVDTVAVTGGNASKLVAASNP